MTLAEFEIFARRIRPRLQATARSVLGSDEDAEDAIQDTLLRLWTIRQRLDRYESHDGFASLVCRNLCISRLRKLSAERNAMLNERETRTEARHATPISLLEDKENATWLSDTIDGLPAQMMLVMKMSQNDQLSNEEIARALGVTETTVRATLCKARKRLFEALKKRR